MNCKVISIITAIIAIGVTIALYSLVINEWTSMIQLSLAIVCVSELAIVGTLGLLPAMNFKNGSTGIMINVYAALMIFWSLLGCNFGGNVYPIGLLIISLVMLILIGLSAMGSHESERLNKEVEQTIDRKQSFTMRRPTGSMINHRTSGDAEVGGQRASFADYHQATAIAEECNLPDMWLTIQSSLDDYDTKKRVRVLIERIQAMPSSRFPDAKIEKGMKEITAMSRALSNPDAQEAHERILNRINTRVKEISNYIKTL